MPAESTVRLWATSDCEGFSAQYARARDLQADALAEEILEIADDGMNDYRLVQTDGREVLQLDSEHIQRSKLRVDARKWFASKVAPKKYGDKLELAGDKDNPLTTVTRIVHEIVDPGNVNAQNPDR